MKQADIVRRYLCILRMVQRPFTYPTKQQIVNRLIEEGFSACSARTFESDKKTIHDWYGISIAHSKPKGGYFINLPEDEDLNEFRQFMRLLERSERLQFLTHTSDALQTGRYLYLEGTDEAITNRPALKLIWEALQRQVQLSLSYQAFNSCNTKQYQLEPVLLMETADHRWYLVAWHAQRFKTFGLERIIPDSIALSPISVKKNRQADFRALKELALGVHISPDDQPEKVKLRFSPKIAPYVKSQPLHPSQQLISECDSGLEVDLWLVINKELERLILGYGEMVEVVEPEQLRSTLAERIEQLAKNYLQKITNK